LYANHRMLSVVKTDIFASIYLIYCYADHRGKEETNKHKQWNYLFQHSKRTKCEKKDSGIVSLSETVATRHTLQKLYKTLAA